jgi:hypothetical protein
VELSRLSRLFLFKLYTTNFDNGRRVSSRNSDIIRRDFFKVLGGAALAMVGFRTANARVCERQGVDYVVETWTSGTEWYRLYKSGWVEQGGYFVHPINVTITLPVPMKNANYWAAISSSRDTIAAGDDGTPKIRNRTSTTIRIHGERGHDSNGNAFWEVKGMAAS